MNFAGVIAEYDPFHNGHRAQLALLRRQGAQTIAVCMSAGAVQRGGLPLYPEPVRVRAALESGADMVIALPAPYACATAQQFAAAGVRLLTALGCDTLAFGAETPDAARLLETARFLRGGALDEPLRTALAEGQTFAAARAAAAEALWPGTGELLRTPNNILGIEYCGAILDQNSPLRPLALPRLGAAHGGSDTGEWQGNAIASASHLRTLSPEALRPFVPETAFALYRQADAQGLRLDKDKFSTALLALLRTKPDFSGVRGVSEGLENRLTAAVRTASDAESLVDALKTKRYPHARLRRLVLDAALDMPARLPPPPYLHVLGARKTAMPRLKQATLPVSTSLSDLVRTGPEAELVGRLHSRVVDFSSLCRAQTGPMGLAFTTKPVVL